FLPQYFELRTEGEFKKLRNLEFSLRPSIQSPLPLRTRMEVVGYFRCILSPTRNEERNANFARFAGHSLGELMKFKRVSTITFCLLGLAIVLAGIALAQQRNAGGGGERGFPQPTPEKEVTVTAIPGVIAAGAK